jgi:PAS domain S-box-containing protein
MANAPGLFLSELLSNAPIILFATDREGRILLSEGGLLKLAETKPGELVGRSAYAEFANTAWVTESIRRVLGGEEHTVVHEAGKGWLEASFTPLKSDDGQITGMVGFATDATARVRAVNMVEARDQVLSVASHDLKTPITSLRSLNELIYRGLRDECQQAPARVVRMVERSLKETEHLGKIVDGLLDITRIRVGQWEATREPFDLSAMVWDVTERFRGEGVAASIRLDLDAPLLGEWDRLKIEQLLANLVANALKFAPGKPVRVSVKDAGDQIRLVVEDEGPGIDLDDQKRIFQCFERGSRKRGTAGLGLGLFIVKQVVDAHGGSVCCESQPGVGSRFIVILPRFAVDKALA